MDYTDHVFPSSYLYAVVKERGVGEYSGKPRKEK
jgi:hypothetical protein